MAELDKFVDPQPKRLCVTKPSLGYFQQEIKVARASQQSKFIVHSATKAVKRFCCEQFSDSKCTIYSQSDNDHKSSNEARSRQIVSYQTSKHPFDGVSIRLAKYHAVMF